MLATALVRQGLPTPKLQHVVRDVDGSFVARVDLAYPEHKIAIEYEGAQHRTDRRQFDKDMLAFEAIAREDYKKFKIEPQ